jgi:hypothetical protein
VNVFVGKTVERLGALVKFFKVGYCEIDVVRYWLGLVAFRSDIDKGQNHWPTVDVMARCPWDASPRIAEQLPVELLRSIEIRDLQDYSVERRCLRHPRGLQNIRFANERCWLEVKRRD